MKPTVLIIALIALSVPATFAAPAAAKRPSGPNRLTEDKAAIERNLKAAETKLAGLTRRLAVKLPKPEAQAFLKAQTTWTAWRDADAEYAAHRYAPTKASSPEIMSLAFEAIVSANKVQMTDDRIKQLEGELAGR